MPKPITSRTAFFSRVNTFLFMLSKVMTELSNKVYTPPDDGKRYDGKLKVEYKPCKAVDPSMEKSMWEQARNRGDISQNEFRAFMGLPPDEDDSQEVLSKQTLQGVAAVAEKATSGAVTTEQAEAILRALGLPDDVAKDIAGDGPKDPPANGGGQLPPPAQGQQPPQPDETEEGQQPPGNKPPKKPVGAPT